MLEASGQVFPWNQELWEQLTSDSERKNHALLLAGHSGLGKLDLGFALAREVISQGHQQSENLFNAGSHPDLHVLLPEADLVALAEDNLLRVFAQRYQEQHSGKPRKNLTIDQIRKLSDALTTHPHISQNRLILIGHAESLNRNAANALLKSLEEPPSKTLFVLVCDEISQLPATIRSRCSIIPVRTPSADVAKSWLQQQGQLPAHEIDHHLAMSNNQPLLAIRLYQSGYIDTLKTVFNDVNGLWSHRRQAVEAAKSWQDNGGARCLEILQKLCVDILRCKLSNSPHTVFFPVQQSWVASAAQKLSTKNLLGTLDGIAEARRLLRTTVDELLVLETVSDHISQLPQAKG